MILLCIINDKSLPYDYRGRSVTMTMIKIITLISQTLGPCLLFCKQNEKENKREQTRVNDNMVANNL